MIDILKHRLLQRQGILEREKQIREIAHIYREFRVQIETIASDSALLRLFGNVVEDFGGKAGVLVNKNPDESTVEVYNDRDSNFVHFEEVLCDRVDVLVQWLETVPYSRAIH